MIVNGKYEFVGSSKSKADFYLEKTLKEPNSTNIELKMLSQQNDKISITYILDGISKGHFLNFAIVEKHTENYVPRGENSGLNLKHENVVRVFQTIYSEQSGKVEMEIDDSITLEDCLLVAYLQDKNDLTIYGASKLAFNTKDNQ